jgi:hypothetical protein
MPNRIALDELVSQALGETYSSAPIEQRSQILNELESDPEKTRSLLAQLDPVFAAKTKEDQDQDLFQLVNETSWPVTLASTPVGAAGGIIKGTGGILETAGQLIGGETGGAPGRAIAGAGQSMVEWAQPEAPADSWKPTVSSGVTSAAQTSATAVGALAAGLNPTTAIPIGLGLVAAGSKAHDVMAEQAPGTDPRLAAAKGAIMGGVVGTAEAVGERFLGALPLFNRLEEASKALGIMDGGKALLKSLAMSLPGEMTEETGQAVLETALDRTMGSGKWGPRVPEHLRPAFMDELKANVKEALLTTPISVLAQGAIHRSVRSVVGGQTLPSDLGDQPGGELPNPNQPTDAQGTPDDPDGITDLTGEAELESEIEKRQTLQPAGIVDEPRPVVADPDATVIRPDGSFEQTDETGGLRPQFARANRLPEANRAFAEWTRGYPIHEDVSQVQGGKLSATYDDFQEKLDELNNAGLSADEAQTEIQALIESMPVEQIKRAAKEYRYDDLFGPMLQEQLKKSQEKQMKDAASADRFYRLVESAILSGSAATEDIVSQAEAMSVETADKILANDVRNIKEYASYGDTPLYRAAKLRIEILQGLKKDLLQTGKPFVAKVYHGTTTGGQMLAFDQDRLGSYTGARSARLGHFFTGNASNARNYSRVLSDHLYQQMRDKITFGTDFTKLAEDLGFIHNPSEKIVEQPGMTVQDLMDVADHNNSEVPQRAKRGAAALFLKQIARERPEDFVTAVLNRYGIALDISQAHSAILPIYIRADNPFVIDIRGQSYSSGNKPRLSEVMAQAKAAGHDVVVFKNMFDPDLDNVFTVLAGHENQIKHEDNIGTWNETDQIYEKRSGPVRAPSTARSVQSTVGALSAGWSKDAPEVVVVQSTADLRAHGIKVAPGQEVAGVHLNGMVYLVADNLSTPADVERTMLHEIAAHYGFERMAGKDLTAILAQVLHIGRTDPAMKQLMKTVRELYPEYGQRETAKELLGAMAETLARPGLRGSMERLAQRIENAFRRFARYLGFRLVLNRADIMAMLQLSMKRATSGQIKLGPKTAPAQFMFMGKRATDFTAAQTGGKTFKGLDNEDRFRISDKDATLNSSALLPVGRSRIRRYVGPLGGLLGHIDLFRNYPTLANVKVDVSVGGASKLRTLGYAVPGPLNEHAREIVIHPGMTEAQVLNVLIHEIQHSIQGYENLNVGGGVRHDLVRMVASDPEMSQLEQQLSGLAMDDPAAAPLLEQRAGRYAKLYDNWENYGRLGGEIEARDAAATAGLDQAALDQTTPYRSQTEINLDNTAPQIEFMGLKGKLLSLSVSQRNKKLKGMTLNKLPVRVVEDQGAQSVVVHERSGKKFLVDNADLTFDPNLDKLVSDDQAFDGGAANFFGLMKLMKLLQREILKADPSNLPGHRWYDALKLMTNSQLPTFSITKDGPKVRMTWDLIARYPAAATRIFAANLGEFVDYLDSSLPLNRASAPRIAPCSIRSWKT